MAFSVNVWVDDFEALDCQVDGSVELGRQRDGEAEPVHMESGRIVIAPMKEVFVSRNHIRIEPLSGQLIQIQNTSKLVPIFVDGVGELGPEVEAEVELPAVIRLGNRVINVAPCSAGPVSTLSHRTLVPGAADLTHATDSSQFEQLNITSSQLEPLIKILQQIIDLFEHATSERELFEEACVATVELLGLNRAEVVMRRNDQWVREAELPRGHSNEDFRSRTKTLLQHSLRDKRVSYLETDGAQAVANTLSPSSFVVVAPLLDKDAEVIGAVCAANDQVDEFQLDSVQTSQLQAQLLELISSACGFQFGPHSTGTRVEGVEVAIRPVFYAKAVSPTRTTARLARRPRRGRQRAVLRHTQL